jgi:HK97 family phage prohead protease
MKVILSTEDLNSYGFWVLTSGIMLKRFKQNPVVTLNHDTWSMSIGKITNIQVENGQLVGEIEFDEEDEKGKELKRKYEKGFMSGFSIGIKILTLSEDPKWIKEGQTRATIIKSELMEIACATVPSNSNAVKLYDADGEILNLSSTKLKTIVPELNKKENKMKEIALALGLSENATQEEINAKIAELKENNKPVIAVVGDNADKAALAAMFVELGTAKAVITDENKADFEKLFELDSKLAVRMINNFASKVEPSTIVDKEETEKVTLTSLIEKLGKGGNSEKEKTFDSLTETELVELREKNTPEYIRLFEKHYGFKPKLD